MRKLILAILLLFSVEAHAASPMSPLNHSSPTNPYNRRFHLPEYKEHECDDKVVKERPRDKFLDVALVFIVVFGGSIFILRLIAKK